MSIERQEVVELYPKYGILIGQNDLGSASDMDNGEPFADDTRGPRLRTSLNVCAPEPER